ncbi:hypothetical protein JCM16303_000587 [Sporobolomyces ruberrimus]
MTSPSSLAQLLALGIPKPKALYALREFDNNADIAADWCFTEGAEWTPNDLLQTSYTPTSALSADSDPTPSSNSRQSFNSPSARSRVHTPPQWELVPSRLVLPGTPVSITLKQDQGTDRTVHGIVQEKLTKGDHPRGVKVRLRDGRVGRIVRILKGSEAEQALGR